MTSPGRALVALRRKVSHSCAVCGKAFRGYVNARYCSDACRWRAAYERRKKTRS